MDFYLNDTDREDLFEFITSKRATLIPDVLFEAPQYYYLTDYESFLKHQLNETVHFFLIHESFSVEPLTLSRNRYIKERDCYSVNQRKGGPYIDLSFYRGHGKDDPIPYKATSISIYPKFIRYDSHEEFGSTTQLKEYYKILIKYIKARCVKRTINGKNYWVSIQTLREI